MKTPSPQEAAKTWAREKAATITNRIWCNVSDEDGARSAIETALLEADKNGYERGRKEGARLSPDVKSVFCFEAGMEDQKIQDEALLGEAFTRIEDFHPPTSHVYRKTCGTCEFLAKLKSRLAPSVGLSEDQKLLADSGGEKGKSE